MQRTFIATLVALAAIGVLPNASAQSNTFMVDCNKGQKIATALEQGDFRKPLVISLRGTCREFVTITRANVTLRGKPNAEIVAPDNAYDLLSVSAGLVALENLTLMGGLAGLALDDSPNFYADKVDIQGASDVGVRVRVGDARLNNCTVQGSGKFGVSLVRGGTALLRNCQILDSGQVGVSVTQNSFVNINGSTIMGSGAQGVMLTQGSGGSISSGTTIAENDGNGIDVGQSQLLVSGGAGDKANTIRDNGGFGIVGHSSSIGIDMNTITGNGRDGVMGYIGTTLVMHGNTISGNNGSGVASMGNSLVQIGGATIENNGSSGITLVWGAKLILEEPQTKVSGSYYALFCADKESSYAAMAPLDTTDQVDCTDFDN